MNEVLCCMSVTLPTEKKSIVPQKEVMPDKHRVMISGCSWFRCACLVGLTGDMKCQKKICAYESMQYEI